MIKKNAAISCERGKLENFWGYFWEEEVKLTKCTKFYWATVTKTNFRFSGPVPNNKGYGQYVFFLNDKFLYFSRFYPFLEKFLMKYIFRKKGLRVLG